MTDAFTQQKDRCIRRYITVRTQYEGFHTYEEAPSEVAFLRNSHRHLFKVTVDIEVLHDDRELEFFIVKNFLDTMVIPYTTMMGNLGSCEQQAERIMQGLVNKYGPARYYTVSVSEDGENDGSVEWLPSY